MTKRLQYLAVLLLLAINASAQIYDPVTWEFSYEKKGDNKYELVFTALIEEHSHIYSMEIPEGGPIPTKIGRAHV